MRHHAPVGVDAVLPLPPPAAAVAQVAGVQALVLHQKETMKQDGRVV